MSKASSLLPLIFLLVVLAIAAFIGFIIYQIANDVQGQTRKKMEKRNISFTKDGMKVGVKEKSTEKYADDTQSVLMKVWNASSWPAYKSKFGWGDTKSTPTAGSSGYGLARTSSAQSHSSSRHSPATSPAVESEKRKPFSRHGSSGARGVPKA